MSPTPIDLRCEYLHNPHGVDAPAPRFSWRWPADAVGGAQTAYELHVADSAGCLMSEAALRWSSGRVASAASTHIAYAGPPLYSGKRYYWRARTWDAAGLRSDWSAPASFFTGVMKAEEWDAAAWIGLPVDPGSSPELRALIADARWITLPSGLSAPEGRNSDVAFRRVVELERGEFEHAELVAASGSNLVFAINERPVTVCQGSRPAVAANVSGMLRGGRNVLAATIVHEGRADTPIALRAALRVRGRDGGERVWLTDGAWQVGIDRPVAWKTTECDASDWPAATPVDDGDRNPGPIEEVVDEHRPVPAVYLRRDFTLPAGIVNAALHIIGLGYHEAYINGRRVGDCVLAPMMTDYRKRVLSLTHDVQNMLRPGRNTIGVILGNGRFFAPRRRVPIPTADFGDPRLRLRLDWTDAEGHCGQVVSDEQWTATIDGPIRANNDYDGERYDATREQPGWCAPDREPPAWRPVVIYPPSTAVVASQFGEPLRVTEQRPAQQIQTTGRGAHVYDFGQNLVGWVRLRVSGPRGTYVRLRHAEQLDDAGELNLDGLRSCRVTDEYVLRGDQEEEIYEPRFTYHGFRFVELTGLPEPLAPEALEACVVHADLERVGRFECSDPTINRIFDNFVWGARGNLRGVPTDCPQRDERHGWLGDIANISKGENYVFRTINFYRKWLDDIQDAQQEDGNLPDLAPAYWALCSGNVTWPAAYVIVADWLYEQFGDRALLRRHYPNFCRWLAHVRAQYVDGVLDYDTYGDWCVPPEDPTLIHSKLPERQTDGALLATATHALVLRRVARIARALGADADADAFAAEARAVATSFHERFFDPDKACYGNGTQTSFALALAADIIPLERRAAVAAAFARRVRETDNGHIATGLVGGQWLLRGLDDCGHTDLALQIARQRSYPSWGYMLERGATTLWELWNGDTADPTMNSHNHLMLAGDLPGWLFERLGGIQSQWETPGYERFVLAPRLVADLQHVDVQHHCIRGEIRSVWRRSDGAIVYRAAVPPHATAELRLNECGAPVRRVALDGRVAWENRRAHGGDVEVNSGGSGPIVTLPPGAYEFEVQF